MSRELDGRSLPRELLLSGPCGHRFAEPIGDATSPRASQNQNNNHRSSQGREDRVPNYTLSSWSTIIEGAQNHRDTLLKSIKNQVQRRDPPNTSWSMQETRTKGGMLSVFSKEHREFLVFENETKDLELYNVRVNVQPYGNTLTVNAALTAYDLSFGGGLSDWVQEELEWEDKQVLQNWTSVLFRSVQDACRDLAEEQGVSPDRVKAEAEGVLSVW